MKWSTCSVSQSVSTKTGYIYPTSIKYCVCNKKSENMPLLRVTFNQNQSLLQPKMRSLSLYITATIKLQVTTSRRLRWHDASFFILVWCSLIQFKPAQCHEQLDWTTQQQGRIRALYPVVLVLSLGVRKFGYYGAERD